MHLMYNNIAVHLLRKLLKIWQLSNFKTLQHEIFVKEIILYSIMCILFSFFPECMPGFYGYNCERQCSQNCNATTGCDKITGHCVGGCKTGWRGMFCDGNVFAVFSD